jgi:hypothetical protein
MEIDIINTGKPLDLRNHVLMMLRECPRVYCYCLRKQLRNPQHPCRDRVCLRRRRLRGLVFLYLRDSDAFAALRVPLSSQFRCFAIKAIQRSPDTGPCVAQRCLLGNGC